MFYVGDRDLPVLTSGNWVIKGWVIKWPVKLLTFFYVFYVFFKIQKNVTFYVFLSGWPRFLEHCQQPMDWPATQGQQQHATSWPVEKIHHTWSFGSDATVLDDYALTMTTPYGFLFRRGNRGSSCSPNKIIGEQLVHPAPPIFFCNLQLKVTLHFNIKILENSPVSGALPQTPL